MKKLVDISNLLQKSRSKYSHSLITLVTVLLFVCLEKPQVSVFVHARCLYIQITRAMYWRLPREVVHVLDSVQSTQKKK